MCVCVCDCVGLSMCVYKCEDSIPVVEGSTVVNSSFSSP